MRRPAHWELAGKFLESSRSTNKVQRTTRRSLLVRAVLPLFLLFLFTNGTDVRLNSQASAANAGSKSLKSQVADFTPSATASTHAIMRSPVREPVFGKDLMQYNG